MEKLELLVKEMKEHGDGADEAFQKLYEASAGRTLEVIRRYCNISADYEDLLQEVYIRVYRSIDSLREDEKVLAWIDKIAANTATRHNMKKWPKMFSELGEPDGMEPDFEDESGSFDPEAIADKQAVAQAVNQILDTLPPDQRTALWMVYGQQITIKEMAENLGISENTIKSRLYRGRNRLLARKEEFCRMGVELTAIPVAALISMTFRQDVYAAAAEYAGSALGSAAAIKEMIRSSAGESAVKSAAGENTVKCMVKSSAAKGVAAGTKILLGAAAVCVIGGGAAAVKINSSSHPDPVKLKIEEYNGREYSMSQAVAVFSPEEALKQAETFFSDQGTPQEPETGSEEETAEKGNHILREDALTAYRDALLYNDKLIAPENGWGDVSMFVLTDINSDDIPEMYVFVPGLSNAETAGYLLYYTDGLNISEPLSWSFGIIPEGHAFISTYSHMSEFVSHYSFDGKKLTEIESFYYERPDSLEYQKDRAKNDRLAAKAGKLYERAQWPDLIPATIDNIEYYLGAAEGRESTDTGAAEVLSFDMNEEIQFIRDTYAYTNAHIDEYQKIEGFPEFYYFDMDNVSTWLTADNKVVKHVTNTDGLIIEAYHLNPSLGRTAEEEHYPEETVIFAFAHDGDGNEYRLYFKDARIIRYIGPDKIVIDYPEGNIYPDFCDTSTELSGGDKIWGILTNIAPGWWIPYEGEGE